MDNIIVTIAGTALIAFIYWFFFGKKEEVIGKKANWNIIVDGGYQPSTIRIPAGKPTTITFTRRDPNPCLEEVVLPDFRMKLFLPLRTPVTVTLSPEKAGQYAMHCGMNMYHGKIEVTE